MKLTIFILLCFSTMACGSSFTTTDGTGTGDEGGKETVLMGSSDSGAAPDETAHAEPSDSGIDSSDSSPSVDPNCTPKSEVDACGSAVCGVAQDGCGGSITCGVCKLPDVCGGGGVAGTCGCTIVDQTTACTGKCGTVSNGCGGTYDCAGCSGVDTCGGGGTEGVCGCTPLSVDRACGDHNCGTAPDGCGGTLQCGVCSGDEVCGGAGVANHCDMCPQDESAFPNVCPSNFPVPRQCPSQVTLPDCGLTTAVNQPTPPNQYCCKS